MLLLQVIVTHLIAALSPGPDVLLTMRNSLAFGRRDGVFTSLGIVSGVAIQITLCLLGLVWSIQRRPGLFHAIAIAGGCYLLYLGWSAVRSRETANPWGDVDASPSRAQSLLSLNRRWIQPVGEGLLTNLLNPKALLYFFSIFTAVLTHDVAPTVRFLAGIGMVFTQLVAFILLASLVTHPGMRRGLHRLQAHLLKIMGFLFLLLGGRILWEHFHPLWLLIPWPNS